ncbi:hypothetical protein V493_02323 [Pseudogymnoascus sp. VKM F-4281 (FW-2241)]|nr:hypothetical protein V493_02323 [Pseudogymnoascus sp. VKM F-4281 (FW-2241)]
MKVLSLFASFLAAEASYAAVLGDVSLQKRASVSGTAVVKLDTSTGSSQHLASGFIYGIPDTQGQIPDHFYTDIGFNFGRSGGAQIPSRGWLGGVNEYIPRFNSTLANYRTSRKFGARFNVLVHDLWGADTTQPSSAPYPGDNGDWSSFDAFLTRLISDMKSNNMIAGVILDIWNEPDLEVFWNRSEAQWIQMWGRAFHHFKRDFPAVGTSGPSLSASPSTGNTWWTNWATFVAQNKSIPTQYAWHMETGGGDMQEAVSTYKTILSQRGLATDAPININEYAVYDEQVPSGAAWWISQLERVNAIGLRGNWLLNGSLHDFMAGLLGKPNAGTPSYDEHAGGYYPAAEFQVYKYYAQNMNGFRVQTIPTADKNGEVYAVVDNDRVRLLAGTRIATGTWEIKLSKLTSIGLPPSGSLKIHTYKFEGSTDHFARYDQSTDLGMYEHTYSNDELTFPIWSNEPITALAFEFSRTTGSSV